MKISHLVLATNNQHKVLEIKAILKRAKIAIPIKTLKDFPAFPSTVEDKKTIEGNAAKKAREVARKTKSWALSDDTGLFIKYLKGKPGVYSARFAGPSCTFQDNNKKVLRLLSKVPLEKRQASFRCIAALSSPLGKVYLAKGRIDGYISLSVQGENGFGYDPIFYVPSLKKTFAQISKSQKNKISHRALAFQQLPDLLKKVLKSSVNR